MFYLLVTLSLLSMGTGVFIVGFGVPIRETTFGTGLLIAGAIAITGGFVLVGLAAAIAELQLMVKALRARVPGVPRPLRPADRKEAGGEKRPAPPRVPFPPRPESEAPPPPPPLPAPPVEAGMPEAPPPELPEPVARQQRPEWLRRAMAEIQSAPEPEPAEGGSGQWPRHADQTAPASFAAHDDAPEHEIAETRPPPAPAPPIAPSRFDAIWPSDRRREPEKRAESEFAPPVRPPERRPPPPVPPLVAPPPAPRPAMPAPDSASAHSEKQPSILKSGMIDEMSYTLFTDGSIEAQMPDGTMRFGSIDELRRHLEQHGE
jgi:hypothetical protein